MKSTQVSRFIAELEKQVSGVRVSEDPPARAGGIMFLDAVYEGRDVSIQWHARKGFGLSRPKEAIYGEGPHELYADPASTARRTAQLLREDSYTEPPTEAPIARVRHLRGMSQADLAKRMNIQQAAVSKLERKRNVEVSTLFRVAKALGVQLEVRFTWEGRTLELNQFEMPGRGVRKSSRRKA